MNRRLVLVLLAASASASPLAQGQALARFDSIEISGSAVVRFAQGLDERVRVGEAGDSGAVEFEVRNGVLHVRPNGGWKFWNPDRAQVEITARELKRVAISGAADFVASQPVQCRDLDVHISGSGLARFDQLQADSLRFRVSGAGDGQMAGRANELQVMVSGRGGFRGENLLAERAKVGVSGVGEVRVWATQWLGVNVSGVGTVDYWGTPQVERQSSGIAKIHEHGAKPLPP